MKHLTRALARFAVAGALGLGAAGGVACGAAAEAAGAYLAGLSAARRGDVESAAIYLSRALERDPGNLALMEQALIHLAAAGRMDQALELANRLAGLDPRQRTANLLLAAEAFREGDFGAARERIGAAPEAFHPLVASLLSAWAAEGAGEIEAAETALEGIGGRPVLDLFADYHLGLMRRARGDAAGSVAAFAELAKGGAATGRMARAAAGAMADAGDLPGAKAALEAAAAAAFGDAAVAADLAAVEAGEVPAPIVKDAAEGASEALFGLGVALGREGDAKLGLFYDRLAIWLRPDLHEARLLAADLLAESGQNELAIRAYEGVPPDSLYGRAAEIGRAEALNEVGRRSEAIEALKALARREPAAAEVHVALGDLLRRDERFGEAAESYDAAVKLSEAEGTPNWALLYQRGISYERSGAWDSAEADFREALKLEPDQPLVLNYLGYSWLDRGENIEPAMEMIRKAVAARPDDGYIVDSLGWGHFLLGEYEEAARVMEQAVELRPVDAVITDHFGDALWMVGRRREAEFQWRRALSFDPAEKDRARIARKLELGLDRVRAEEEEAKAKAAAEATAERKKNGG